MSHGRVPYHFTLLVRSFIISRCVNSTRGDLFCGGSMSLSRVKGAERKNRQAPSLSTQHLAAGDRTRGAQFAEMAFFRLRSLYRECLGGPLV